MKINKITIKLSAIITIVAALISIFSICTLAASAEATAFINAVNDLDQVNAETDLNEKYTKMVEADAALEEYLAIDGNSKTDTDIANAMAKLTSNKNIMFIMYVRKAQEYYENGDLLSTKPLFTICTEIKAGIDESNTSVESIMSKYYEIKGDLEEFDMPYQSYIERANAAEAATKFSDIKSHYDRAMNLESQLTVSDYPGLAEAKTKLTAARKTMIRIQTEAIPFLEAADSFQSTDNIMTAIKKCYELYEGIDVSVTGVDSAKFNVDVFVKNYNKTVKADNEFNEKANQIVYAFVLGN